MSVMYWVLGIVISYPSAHAPAYFWLPWHSPSKASGSKGSTFKTSLNSHHASGGRYCFTPIFKTGTKGYLLETKITCQI